MPLCVLQVLAPQWHQQATMVLLLTRGTGGWMTRGTCGWMTRGTGGWMHLGSHAEDFAAKLTFDTKCALQTFRVCCRDVILTHLA